MHEAGFYFVWQRLYLPLACLKSFLLLFLFVSFNPFWVSNRFILVGKKLKLPRLHYLPMPSPLPRAMAKWSLPGYIKLLDFKFVFINIIRLWFIRWKRLTGVYLRTTHISINICKMKQIFSIFSNLIALFIQNTKEQTRSQITSVPDLTSQTLIRIQLLFSRPD